ncbi:Ribosome production factor 1 [Gracilariopsis chorda]|uniref:Ribosome production factor 1 n=1 Tax=Gracilariopsis chorda TaxID=448386 RepID=A0A2V3IHI3_9FLOR|nr:Ribosome production factor 1 [Gracilariopsis chorda]|eukprot:PXF41554.1 Ribosome production factor 1 [Gracilariopsis chorda]
MSEEKQPDHTLLRIASSKNRIVKSTLRTRRQRQQKKEKAERRRKRQNEEEQLGDAAPEKPQPRTIESSRIYDDETGQPLTREQALAINDEFTLVLAGEKKPIHRYHHGAQTHKRFPRFR